MKKISIGIVAVVMAILLAACGATPKKPDMYIEKARLTEQESKIAELLGAKDGQLIYDFVLDSSVKNFRIGIYKLVDGAWLENSGGSQPLTDKKGRLSLGFENLADGMRVALQCERNSGSYSFKHEKREDFTGMSRATSTLQDLTEIAYEQEIPLAIQISTAKETVSSYNVKYYFTPDEYTKLGYEHVYAITIKFSKT